MKCSNCGYELEKNDFFCPNCGEKTQEVKVVKKVSKKGEINDSHQVNQYMENDINYRQSFNNEQYNRNNEENGKIIKICVAIVITMIILAVIVVSSYAIISKINKGNNNNNNNVSETTSNTTSVTTPTKTTSSESNTVTPAQVSTTQSTSTYKINYNGFNFYIPDNLIYKEASTDNGLLIGDKQYTWKAQLAVYNNVPFGKIKESNVTDKIKEAFPEITIVDSKSENIDGVESIILEAKLAGTNVLLVFAELNSMNTVFIQIENDNNEFDINVLKNITSIIKTAEYVGENKNIEMNGKIKFEDMNKALKKYIK